MVKPGKQKCPHNRSRVRSKEFTATLQNYACPDTETKGHLVLSTERLQYSVTPLRLNRETWNTVDTSI